MRQMSVISGHPISIGFCRLTGCQRDPWDRGVITWYQSLGKQLPRELRSGYP